MKLGQVAANATETIATETAKLNLGEDTNNNDDPFASDAEADPEEDEAVIRRVNNLKSYFNHYCVDL